MGGRAGWWRRRGRRRGRVRSILPRPVAIIPVYDPPMNYELFMGEALAEARQAVTRGAPPVGAIAVMNEAMVARATNRVVETSDPTAHAVMAVIRDAARKLGTVHLSDITIFTTVEPCAMCVGAMLECDAAALVYALPNPVDGAAGSVIELASNPRLTHRLKVVSGIRRDEAEELMAGLVAVPSGA